MRQVKRRSAALKALAEIIMVLLATAIAVEGWAILRTDDPSTAAAWQLIFRLPTIFYLTALWAVRSAFAELARGVMFDQLAPRLLARVGWFVAAGAGADVLATPLLLRLVYGPKKWSAVANFDAGAITLGVVGLALVVLARLLVQAAEMRNELDDFL